MSYSNKYLEQVKLLLDILPVINKQGCFALKGGTAINLFMRDMPRLSVDIDLAYLPIEPREEFLKNIQREVEILSQNIKSLPNKNIKVEKQFTKDKLLSKLLVKNITSGIIIEPNLILRGSVYPSEERELCERAQNEFLTYCSIRTLSFADIYAGKICAALARQHPRDLFDVRLLLKNEGISEATRKAFVIYLASNSRPIHELLNQNPNLENMKRIYNEGFVGMTDEDVSYESLVETRIKLIEILLKNMSYHEKQFLISVKEGNPNWDLMELDGIKQLPGLEWKLININKMEKQKKEASLEKLKKILAI